MWDKLQICYEEKKEEAKLNSPSHGRLKTRSHYELPHSTRRDRKSEGFSGGVVSEDRKQKVRRQKNEVIKKIALPLREGRGSKPVYRRN